MYHCCLGIASVQSLKHVTIFARVARINAPPFQIGADTNRNESTIFCR